MNIGHGVNNGSQRAVRADDDHPTRHLFAEMQRLHREGRADLRGF